VCDAEEDDESWTRERRHFLSGYRDVCTQSALNH
jgi:hypothetical protein